MVRFSHFVLFYALLLLPPLKPNLEPSSSIANKPPSFDLHSKKLATLNHQPPSIATISKWLVSPTIPSTINAHGPWKCNSFGLLMQLSRVSLTSSISPGKKILQTTRVSIILALTMYQSVLGIFTNQHLSANSQEHASQAL
jgi:hypothetical protein